MSAHRTPVLDHGYVELRNVSGPTRRPEAEWDAHDRDPANAARMSFAASDRDERPIEDDLKLADYLMRNRHTTPFEMIDTVWEMKLPIFVARQFVRHRTVSINEVSARYVQLPAEFYIPAPDTVGIKGATQKQGRVVTEDLTADQKLAVERYRFDLRTNSDEAYQRYQEAIGDGIPHELARCYLPLNIYTRWLWKQDLHNLMHFLALRVDPHAQWEARQYAEAMISLLRRALPATMDIFHKHRRLG